MSKILNERLGHRIIWLRNKRHVCGGRKEEIGREKLTKPCLLSQKK